MPRAFRFGAIERGVGIGEQRRRVGAVVREDGDADAQADAQRIAVDLDVVVERRAEAAPPALRRCRGCAPVGV